MRLRSPVLPLARAFRKQDDQNVSKHLRFLRQITTSLGKQLRVAVMGPARAGKTTVVNSIYRCLHGNKEARSHDNKTDCSSQNNRHRLQKGSFTLEVMDTSSAMPPNFKNLLIRNANVFVLVYDVTDMASFDEVSQIREKIVDLKGEEIPMIVLGNKLDKGVRKVDPILADCVVSMDWEALHFEISANDSWRMYEIFDLLVVHPSIKGIQEHFDRYAKLLNEDNAMYLGQPCFRKRSQSFLTWLRTQIY